MVYYLQNVMEDDFQASDDSFSLIHQAHGYMHRFEMPGRRRPYLSGRARSMWIEFKQGVVSGLNSTDQKSVNTVLRNWSFATLMF